MDNLDVSGETMVDITREEIDAKITAGESRTETKLVHFGGKLDLVVAKIDSMVEKFDFMVDKIDSLGVQVREERKERVADGKNTRTAIIITVISSMITMFIGVVIILQFGDQMFSRGVSQRDVAISILKEMQSSGAHDQPPAK